MIFLRRPRKPPNSLANGSLADLERNAVLQFFNKVRGRVKFVGRAFKAYKQPDVVDALAEMSRGKCAYCESIFIVTQPMAVEHYRPKNQVLHTKTGKIVYPGYPWLAYEWVNLLPSCTDCNSERHHDTPDGKIVVGKANQFPLLDENKRAKKPGDEKREVPLLLNPSRDKVQRFFRFCDDGSMVPRARAGLAWERANKTIEVCALYRIELINARKTLVVDIQKDIALLRGHIDLMNKNPQMDGLPQLIALIERLRMYLQPGRPYTAMASQYIEPVIRELTT